MTLQSIRRQGLHHTTSSFWRRYGFAWVTGIIFVLAFIGHWWLGWLAYLDEQQAMKAPPLVSDYLVEVGRDTLENWQSEFLQLLWQVAGLAYLFYVGSPQSREGNDRQEAKLDAILRAVDGRNAEKIIAELDKNFDRS
jgi:hypothetical protein